MKPHSTFLRSSLITRDEWKFVAIIGSTILFFASAPYFIGYFFVPSDTFYLGISAQNTADDMSYLSWIEQARGGATFFRELYTTEFAPANLFHPLFLLLGFAGKAFFLPSILIFQLGRVFFGALLFFVAYRFIAFFTDEVSVRRSAFLFLGITSGLGFLFGLYSPDLWMPESITFFALFDSVLDLSAMLLMIGIFSTILRSLRGRNRTAMLLGAFLLNMLIVIHPYNAVIVLAVSVLFALSRVFLSHERALLWNVLELFLLSFPAFFWQLHVLSSNEALGVWYFLQTKAVSPPFLDYMKTYAPYILCMIPLFLDKNRRVIFARYQLLFLWVVVSFLFAYAPVAYQRKFVEGVHIPLALLAAFGVSSLRRELSRVFVPAILILLSVTNVLLLVTQTRSILRYTWPTSLSREEYRATEWIARNIPPDQSILAGEFMGNVIPAMSARFVYLGHVDQTTNYDLKRSFMHQILAPGVSHERTWKVLRAHTNVRYVLVDKEMRRQGEGLLTGISGMTLAYENSDIQIYRLMK